MKKAEKIHTMFKYVLAVVFFAHGNVYAAKHPLTYRTPNGSGNVYINHVELCFDYSKSATNEIIVAQQSSWKDVPDETAWVRTGPNTYENPTFTYMPKITVLSNIWVDVVDITKPDKPLKQLPGYEIAATSSDGKLWKSIFFIRNHDMKILWGIVGRMHDFVNKDVGYFQLNGLGVKDAEKDLVLKTGRFPAAERCEQLEKERKQKSAIK